MRSLARATVLFVAAMVLTWQGVLLSTPHNHADDTVPQEELACSASHPLSQTSHLHGSGELIAPRPCVACVIGSTVADTPGIAEINDSTDGTSAVTGESTDFRSRLHARLPLLRGPPLTA